ncbi:MAG: hypothetical protein AAF629_33105 [Chloroflexota bacterium]
MKRTKQPFTLITPTCTCCSEAKALLARDDLATGLVTCAQSGQLYQSDENGKYTPTEMPTRSPRSGPAAGVQIDLSRSGYA